MDNNPLLSGILWILQILTAGVLLFHAYFDMLVDVRQKRRAPSAAPDAQPKPARKSIETQQSAPTQGSPAPIECERPEPSKAE